MSGWYGRPVFFVADVARALDFYVGKLGFVEAWRFGEDGKAIVAQADREGFELIFSSQWPDKIGKGMVFLELTREGFAALPGELADAGVSSRAGHWGYPVIIVVDPDGNELYFPDPDSEIA
jgi:catechol 2,3-dioxygenase-like lactoylglutathione lyase family enzyme